MARVFLELRKVALVMPGAVPWGDTGEDVWHRLQGMVGVLAPLANHISGLSACNVKTASWPVPLKFSGCQTPAKDTCATLPSGQLGQGTTSIWRLTAQAQPQNISCRPCCFKRVQGTRARQGQKVGALEKPLFQPYVAGR